ncbi:MAG: J domain-containing protein [Pseudomonas sp.]
MNCWSILGVEPSSDPRTIKRAYARLLKDVHPEEHPEDFMALREAYETALGHIAWQQSQPRSAAPQVAEQPAPEFTCQATEPVEKPIPSEPQPSEQELEYQQFMQRLQQLVNDLHDLLSDTQQRNKLSRWEALLLAPELNNLEARLAVGNSLLPAVLQVLHSSGEDNLPAAVVNRLDERFHWCSDQSAHWQVAPAQLHCLSLLVDAAKSSLSREKKPLGWRWLARSMFRWKAPLSRMEYLFVQGVTVGLGAVLISLWVSLPKPGIPEPIYLLAVLALLYALLTAHAKRIEDTGANIALIFVIGIFFPLAHLIVPLGARSGPALSGNDPRVLYTDPYQIALAEYFDNQRKQSIGQRIKNFCTAIQPGPINLLAFSWLISGLIWLVIWLVI